MDRIHVTSAAMKEETQPTANRLPEISVLDTINLVMEMLRKARSHFKSIEDLNLFLHIFLFLTILPVLIKLLSLPRLMHVLTPLKPDDYRNPNQETKEEMIVKFTDFILSLNFLMYKNICLKRSLVLYHFLRRKGMNVYVCFGCRLEDIESKKKLGGHAWLVYRGDVFLERNKSIAKSYQTIYCFPESIK